MIGTVWLGEGEEWDVGQAHRSNFWACRSMNIIVPRVFVGLVAMVQEHARREGELPNPRDGSER